MTRHRGGQTWRSKGASCSKAAHSQMSSQAAEDRRIPGQMVKKGGRRMTFLAKGVSPWELSRAPAWIIWHAVGAILGRRASGGQVGPGALWKRSLLCRFAGEPTTGPGAGHQGLQLFSGRLCQGVQLVPSWVQLQASSEWPRPWIPECACHSPKLMGRVSYCSMEMPRQCKPGVLTEGLSSCCPLS